jgi:SAM-dependent methyltransferase
LEKWDASQTSFLLHREQRFEVMFEALEDLFADDLTAVDLGCGPGSLTSRLLSRLPRARVTAIDLDPVLVTVGRAVLGDAGGRLVWLEADLRKGDWVDRLPWRPVHAVLSTTALHWLPHEELAATYRRAYEVLTDGGVLLNGDHMRFSSEQPTLERLAEKIADKRIERQPGKPGLAGWDAWWQGLRQEPGMHELFAERERRFAWRLEKRIAGEAGVDFRAVTWERQRELALAAGFRETGSVWQNLDNRVLIAVK